MGSRDFRGDTKQAVEGEASANAVAAADNMKTLILVGFLTVAVLCLCQGDDSAHSNSAADSPSSEAFISRRDSAEVVKRNKRHYGRFYDIIAAGFAPPPSRTPDPLEPYRETCEYNPSCDELADHIGFHEAYRRYYGPLP
ncbi:osteocalcin [Tiliqua scincoides]|uniref:osteocalcin n=1 Tax=Tiliqua scincoides TaxID=71010 RepID=UPI0034626C27